MLAALFILPSTGAYGAESRSYSPFLSVLASLLLFIAATLFHTCALAQGSSFQQEGYKLYIFGNRQAAVWIPPYYEPDLGSVNTGMGSAFTANLLTLLQRAGYCLVSRLL